MNVSPMDMQVIIPKATEVGKVQHNQDQQSVLQQDFSAHQMKQEARQRMNQVQNSEKSEGQRIRRDGKNAQGGQQGSSGQKQEKEELKEDERMAVDTFRGRRIDIKL